MPHTMNTKYRACKCTIGGEKIDSRAEARRYLELMALAQAGEIADLQRQVRFEIIPSQPEHKERASYYVADFTYTEKGGARIVEDAKSAFTKHLPTYILKRKLFKMRYAPQGWVFREWVAPGTIKRKRAKKNK